jgi:AcrR family transcriptional regulator
MARSSRKRSESDDEVQQRILEAAFAAFKERGYAATSTLEIATSARVSKRELYALVGNKQEMLAASIRERAKRFEISADLPAPNDFKTLEKTLISFGAKLVREVSDPGVIGAFRLAISEVRNAPEVAQAVDAIGREAVRSALRKIMAQAESAGLLRGRPENLAEQFGGLLWRDLLVSLLLGVTKRPNAAAAADRAREATAALLELHS